MKFVSSLLLFVVSSSLFGQTDTIKLKQNVRNLDEALLRNDTVTLVRLLDEKVTYGHSNGWVESRADIFRDLRRGYLVYNKIESSDIKFTGDKDWTNVRMNANVSGKLMKMLLI